MGGGVFGLALARYLFEFNPFQLGILGEWPGAMGLALAGAAAGAGLRALAGVRAAPTMAWAPLALILPLLHILAPDVNRLRGAVLLGGSAALCLLLVRNIKSMAMGLFLVLFAIYMAGLAPAVGEADTFEFQVGIARLGIAHGSGYPLLMMVGKFFSLLPVGGTLAWRANLTSAFFGALAGVGVERLARRLGAAPLVAALAGLAFGLSPTLWSRAVEVEAYTLNAALVAALLLVCLDLVRDDKSSVTFQVSRVTVSVSRFALAAFLFGLSLTNHLTTLLLAPAIALAVMIALRRGRADGDSAAGEGRTFGGALRMGLRQLLLPFLLGVSVYLYVPLRWPAVNQGEWMTLAQFANVLAGNEARGAFQWALPWRDAGRWAIAWEKIAGEYGVAGLALAGVGLLAPLLWALEREKLRAGDGKTSGGHWRRAASGLLVLAYLPYVYFALAFNVPDPDFSAFFIPLHLMAAVMMAPGLEFIMGAVSGVTRRIFRSGHDAPRAVLTVMFAILPLQALWTTLPRVDQSGDWERQRLGAFILSQPLAEGAAILADSQKIAPLYYLQVAEGVRPDLDIIVLPDEAAYRAVLDERIAAGQVVYLARYLPGLGSGYSLRSVGPVAEVSPMPFTIPPELVVPPATPLEGAGIRLAGYDGGTAGSLTAERGAVRLSLVWEAQDTPEANLLVYLRLVNAAGEVTWQSAGAVPVGGLYPTNAWRPGEYVQDYYEIAVPAYVAPGPYQLEAGLFPPFAPGPDGWAEVGEVEVPMPEPPPEPGHLLRARMGDQWLLGYDLPETAAHGAVVPVTLYWQRGEAKSITALGETRPVDAWAEGAVALVRYELNAPATGAALDIEVATGQSARCGWLAPSTPTCPLPTVRLVGETAAPGAINFANLLLLRRADLNTTSAPPGGQVAVRLEWQALQTMAEDYTVFVHLLGPDGLVYGQVDAWPVSGTRATSTWTPGEIIADPYLVPVALDAPPGPYAVEVGLYLLATNERLRVLNADGAPVDDRVLLAGLDITP